MTILRTSFPESIKAGLRKWIVDGIRQEADYVPFVANMQTTSSAFAYDNDYAGLTQFEETAENGSVPYEDPENGYKTVYIPKQFMKGTQISKVAVDDDLYADSPTKKRAQMLGRAWVRKRNNDFFSIFRNGFTAANTSYGDGKPLFSTLHPVPDGSFTQSNACSTGDVFSNDALETMILQMQEVLDLRGEMDSRGTGTLLLMVPPKLRSAVVQATESERIAHEFSNTINIHFGGLKKTTKTITPGSNAYSSNKYDIQVLINPYISARNSGSDTAWFLLEKDYHDINFISRMALEIDEEEDFDTKALKMSGMGRYTYGWSGWKSANASAGDSAVYAL